MKKKGVNKKNFFVYFFVVMFFILLLFAVIYLANKKEITGQASLKRIDSSKDSEEGFSLKKIVDVVKNIFVPSTEKVKKSEKVSGISKPQEFYYRDIEGIESSYLERDLPYISETYRGEFEDISLKENLIYPYQKQPKHYGYLIQLKEPSLIEKKTEIEERIESGENINQINEEFSEKFNAPVKTKSSLGTLFRNLNLKTIMGMLIKKDNNPPTQKEDITNKNTEGIDSEINELLQDQAIIINGEQEIFQESLFEIAPQISRADVVEYSKTFNGVAVLKELTPQELEEIKNLPQVKSVSPNYKVKITLYLENVSDEGNVQNIQRDDDERDLRGVVGPGQWQWPLGLIGAGDVWEQGYRGDGVTIAIIDTGIDSEHSDLRGKIIAEHCYSELNACPNGEAEQHGEGAGMDDNGHGTHVAGIAAGNLFGVAPNADLVSIKVLNSEGGGYMSDVISGIEIAVDPNEDNNLEDHSDIISMSLGYYEGTPDGPDAIAVDNAVNLGVVVVAAAGNAGGSSTHLGYLFIGCPGCARKAITIGASNSSDKMAWFSSRGPTSIGTIKPDIVAPGVNICSSQWDNAWEDRGCYDNEHVALSGTSMATPLVAGAIALIKQAHPDWSPAEIKMALRNTGIDLNEDVFTQGYGRVDVLEAVNLEYVPPVAELFTSGEVNGETLITGIVTGNNYSLYYGEGRDPQEWTEIECERREGRQLRRIDGYQNLCLFETSYNNESEHILKLFVRDENGQVSEDKTLINVNNIEITNLSGYNDISKASYDDLRPIDVIEIEGYILNNGFENYEIEWGFGEEPEEWFTEGIQLTNNGRNREGILARFNTSSINIDEVGYYIIKLIVNTDINSVYGYTKIYLDPTIRRGWPIDTNRNIPGMATGLVNIEDIDNDGNSEIIFTSRDGYSRDGYIDILNQDGLPFSEGWPKHIEEGVVDYTIGDLNGDGVKEIVVYGRGSIFVLNQDGSIVEGWPKILEVSAGACKTSLGDIDNDGDLEIIACTGGALKNGEIIHYRTIYAFHHNGDIVEGWPVETEYPFKPGSVPLLVDMNNDGNLETIVRTFNYIDRGVSAIEAFHHNGERVNNFPAYYNSQGQAIVAGDINKDSQIEIINKNIQINRYGNIVENWNLQGGDYITSIALGDVNDDGYVEIAYGSVDGIVNLVDYLGNSLEGWPIIIRHSVYETVFGNIIIGDIDGNLSPEILVGAYTLIDATPYFSKLYAFNMDGTSVRGFPKITWGVTHMNIALADIDNDRNVELISISRGIGSSRGKIFVWNLGNYNPSTMHWPMFQHDPQHTGLYKYLFSCSNRYNYVWRDNNEIIRRDAYNILTDNCNGFRCLNRGNEISPACYNQRQCNRACTDSGSCINISEQKGMCREYGGGGVPDILRRED